MATPPTKAELKQRPSLQELQDRWQQKNPGDPLPMKLSGKGGGKYQPGERLSDADAARISANIARAKAKTAAENHLGLNGEPTATV